MKLPLPRLCLTTVLLGLMLAMTTAVQAEKPTVWLIGDSTVKSGTKDHLGWGSVLSQHFDAAKVKVENRALGGRSSRTFLTGGLWEKVRSEIKPGDYLLMQFGHNDASVINEDAPATKASRSRGTIRSNGEETKEIVNVLTGQPEVVHTFGWYLKKFIIEGKAAGAQVIVVSPIPKRGFLNGKARRDGGGYATLAREVAEANGASFLNLSALVADKYDAMGEPASVAFFSDSVHTTPEGAELNARCVVEGIRGLSGIDLKSQLLPEKTEK